MPDVRIARSPVDVATDRPCSANYSIKFGDHAADLCRIIQTNDPGQRVGSSLQAVLKEPSYDRVPTVSTPWLMLTHARYGLGSDFAVKASLILFAVGGKSLYRIVLVRSAKP